jgi:hypothetical protein
MNWKIIISLFVLICLALTFQFFTEKNVEQLTTLDVDQLKIILEKDGLSNAEKIKEIEKLNIIDDRLRFLLNLRNNNRRFVSNEELVRKISNMVEQQEREEELGLSSIEITRIKDILGTSRLTPRKKIEAVKLLNVKSKKVNKIIKGHRPDMQKVVDLLKLLP